MASTNAARLAELRSQLQSHGVGAYVVLTQDEHDSEYTSLADNRREFISGFTGSAGTAIITADKALLATDGRYFLQAEKELDKANWEVLKQGVPGVPTWQQWLSQHVLSTGVKIGVDPELISYSEYNGLIEALCKNALSADHVVPVKPNLIDQIWGPDQPARSDEQIKILPTKYTGKSFEDKLKELRESIVKERGMGFLVAALDQIAWLYNLRGGDVPFNPVFRSFTYVTNDKAVLYIDENKVNAEISEYLAGKVEIKPYRAIFDDAKIAKDFLLEANSKAASLEDRKKILVSSSTSWALYDAFGGAETVSVVPSPVDLAKSIKNPTEIEGFYTSHVKDGVALIRYFSWLENELINGNTTLSDYAAGVKAEGFRAQMPDYRGLSFETISSSGPNAAVIHYAPAIDSKFYVDINQVYLCDSGAQYLDGTTDTTRTLYFGDCPTEEEIIAYTSVLKGHIALASIVFPEGVNGYMLDALARQYLWAEGLDYRHGTGHGVGSYLNVHEGPIGVGLRLNYTQNALQIGNVISNEPGFYKDGSFGIRIENMVVVKEVKTPNNFGGKKFLGFDTVTRVPYCRKLIDVGRLTESEIAWVNAYHAKVRAETEGHLAGDELSLAWLRRETEPL
ncbi:hypothetical protein D0Z03_000080 [Geotrichum reessii]|nr:hypothetical protein D0Z03_000080 [Galactomyces reessii]